MNNYEYDEIEQMQQELNNIDNMLKEAQTKIDSLKQTKEILSDDKKNKEK